MITPAGSVRELESLSANPGADKPFSPSRGRDQNSARVNRKLSENPSAQLRQSIAGSEDSSDQIDLHLTSSLATSSSRSLEQLRDEATPRNNSEHLDDSSSSGEYVTAGTRPNPDNLQKRRKSNETSTGAGASWASAVAN